MTSPEIFDWQTRVVFERAELDGKIARLAVFINSDAGFDDLALHDQELLIEQLSHMRGYSYVLGARISRFTTNN